MAVLIESSVKLTLTHLVFHLQDMLTIQNHAVCESGDKSLEQLHSHVSFRMIGVTFRCLGDRQVLRSRRSVSHLNAPRIEQCCALSEAFRAPKRKATFP